MPRPLGVLAGKRLLGVLSWHLKRKIRHEPKVLRALCADVAAHDPAHTLITGDLTNLALPSEFRAARTWLEEFGPPSMVSVVPGNHDALVRLPDGQGLELWQPWMTGDGEWPSSGGTAFPYVRVRGEVAFVGLSSAVVTPPLWASGKLGAAQAERVRQVLAKLAGKGLFRVLAVHHPPVDGLLNRRKALSDRSLLAEIVSTAGAELIVHGHCHYAAFSALAGPHGSVPAIGTPSASECFLRKKRRARWHLFRVTRLSDGWKLTLTVRGLDKDGDFERIGGWSMTLPAGAHGDTGRRDGLVTAASLEREGGRDAEEPLARPEL